MIFLKLFYILINNQYVFNRRLSKMYLSNKIKISNKQDKVINDENIIEYKPKSVKQKEYKKSLYNPNDIIIKIIGKIISL